MKPIIHISLLLFLCLYFITVNAQQTIFTQKAILPHSLRESSGVECISGKLWSFEDSGNSPSIFRIDTTTGEVLQQVDISNFKNIDWEDITSDADYIYIGDFGNNDGNRKDLRILKIAKADIDTSASQSVTAVTITFSYPDQTSFVVDGNNNYDCESLISFGDSLYIFTKNHGNLQSRLYSLPKDTGTYSANLISQYDVKGKITAATVNPSNNQIALLGYQNSHYGSFILFLNNFTGSDFFSGTKQRYVIVDNNIDWQTEGLAYVTDDHLFLTCEATNPISATLYSADYGIITNHILSVNQLSERPTGALVYPNPSNGNIVISNELQAFGYKLYNVQGVLVYEGTLKDNTTILSIDLSAYPNGLYIMELNTISGNYFEKISLKNGSN